MAEVIVNTPVNPYWRTTVPGRFMTIVDSLVDPPFSVAQWAEGSARLEVDAIAAGDESLAAQHKVVRRAEMGVLAEEGHSMEKLRAAFIDACFTASQGDSAIVDTPESIQAEETQ